MKLNPQLLMNNWATIGIAFLLSTAGCKSELKLEPADLILFNGQIQTVDDSLNVVSAIAFADGKILALGSDAEIKAGYSAKESIDLKGANAYPGLIDPHCHFYGYGLTLRHADLKGTTSWENVLEKLQEHQTENPSNWVLGRGWDQNDWEEKAYPTKTSLDALYPDKPALLTRIDGHAVIANQVALDLAKITAESAIEGGEILQENGVLTGVLIDNAADSLKNLIPEASRIEKIQALKTAEKNCFAVGLTSVGDAGLAGETIELIESIQNAGDLSMRMFTMIEGTVDNLDSLLAIGPRRSEKLNVSSVKMYADGALGSRGAKLLHEYDDKHDHSGLLIHTEENLRTIYAKAKNAGFQVCTHGIGDGAVKLILDLYSELLEPGNDLRWRIEHAQVVNPSDLPRFEKYAVIPSVQSTHATSDMYWAEERLGPQRVKHAYAYNDLLKTNGWIPNGSDFPIESINPLYGFYAAVERKDHKGWPESGFQMENSLTREDALKAMTIWAAKAQFEEAEKGSLEVGKLADLVVLDRDLLTSPGESLFDTKVKMTILGGNIVYSE